MKILMIGDIVGSGGRTAFARLVAIYRGKGKADFVVVSPAGVWKIWLSGLNYMPMSTDPLLP